MEEAQKNPTFFKISRAVWIILGIWLLINFGAAFSKGPSPYELGYAIGYAIAPFVLSWVIATIVWFASKKSQKAADITMIALLVLLIFGSVGQLFG